LTFVERNGGPAYYSEEYPGTTTQEAIRAAIDRTKFVDNLLPCFENKMAIENLQLALYWLEKRVYLKRQQKLACVNQAHQEGGRVPFWSLDIEQLSTCPTCRHIHCDEHKTI